MCVCVCVRACVRVCVFQTYDHRRQVLSEISTVLSQHQYLQPVLERFGELFTSVSILHELYRVTRNIYNMQKYLRS